MQLKHTEPVVKKFYNVLKRQSIGASVPRVRSRRFSAPPCLQACGYHKTDWVQVSGHGRLIYFTLPGPHNDKPYLKEFGQVRLRRRRYR